MTQVACIGFPVSAALAAVLKTADRDLFSIKQFLDPCATIEVLSFILQNELVSGDDAELVKIVSSAPYKIRIVYLPDAQAFWVVSSTILPDTGLGFDLAYWSGEAHHFKNFLRLTLQVNQPAAIAEQVKFKVSTLS